MSQPVERLVARVCPPQVRQLGIGPQIAVAVEEILGAAPPPLRTLLRAAAATAGTGAPLPKPLAQAVRDLVVLVAYEQPEVHRALGYDMGAWVRSVAAQRATRWGPAIAGQAAAVLTPDPLVPTHAVAPPKISGVMMSSVSSQPPAHVDAVIVGSGAGGAVIAAELAESGWDVLVLEEGPYVATQEFTPADALHSFRRLYRDGGLTALLGRPPVTYGEGRCVGGSTTVNGGMAWRTPGRVLERWRNDHQLGTLDEDTITPMFERVERRLSVSPQDDTSIGRDQRLLKSGAEALGWRVVDNLRAHVHCGGCNVCILGCPTGAKQSTLVSYLPRAVRWGATVLADCRVDRVLFTGKRASGVRATTGDGRRVTINADRIIVAAGAIQTPALLQRSGVRSPSGQLGRNLAVHPGANAVAVFDDPVEGWKGVHQAYQVREFIDEGVLMAAVNLPPGLVARSLPLGGPQLGAAMAKYDHMVTAGVLVDDTATGSVRAFGGRAVARYSLSADDGRRIAHALGRLVSLLLAAGATTVYLPFRGSAPVSSAAGAAAVERLPVHRIAANTVHLMGTARMGGDPLQSVCDPTGRVWDTAGLYVADASLLPTPLGINPMETIMMLATHVARGLIVDAENLT